MHSAKCVDLSIFLLKHTFADLIISIHGSVTTAKVLTSGFPGFSNAATDVCDAILSAVPWLVLEIKAALMAVS